MYTFANGVFEIFLKYVSIKLIEWTAVKKERFPNMLRYETMSIELQG